MSLLSRNYYKKLLQGLVRVMSSRGRSSHRSQENVLPCASAISGRLWVIVENRRPSSRKEFVCLSFLRLFAAECSALKIAARSTFECMLTSSWRRGSITCRSVPPRLENLSSCRRERLLNFRYRASQRGSLEGVNFASTNLNDTKTWASISLRNAYNRAAISSIGPFAQTLFSAWQKLLYLRCCVPSSIFNLFNFAKS